MYRTSIVLMSYCVYNSNKVSSHTVIEVGILIKTDSSGVSRLRCAREQICFMSFSTAMVIVLVCPAIVLVTSFLFLYAHSIV